MNRQRQCNTQATQHQRGAVAIIVALCLTLLVGMLGLVLDLGHLYVAKTELQNAADAAALSGAKELNDTLDGVNNAATRAIETAGRNNYDLNAKAVDIVAANLNFSNSPGGPWVGVGAALASPTGKTFLKVDTGSKSISTWFIKVLPGATTTTQTFGMAVAGIYSYPVVPLGICKLPHDLTDPTMQVADLGYKRGVTYKMDEANPIGPGTMYWIDPVTVTNTADNTTTCNGSVPDSLPYICAGKVNFSPQKNQYVYTNTGISVPQLNALDSRFNIYTTNAKCSPSTAPPDTNIKSYAYNGSGGQPKDWMTTAPTQQSIQFGWYSCNSTTPYTCTDRCGSGRNPRVCSSSDVGITPTVTVAWRPKPFLLTNPINQTNQTVGTNYGVLWSASRPVNKAVGDWNDKSGVLGSGLYKALTTISYPEPSPYNQTSSPYYQGVTGGNTGVPDRRMLNITMIECSTAGGICRPAKVLGVGKFFLQRQVSVDNSVYLEYAGLQPNPLPPDDIRLYR